MEHIIIEPVKKTTSKLVHSCVVNKGKNQSNPKFPALTINIKSSARE